MIDRAEINNRAKKLLQKIYSIYPSDTVAQLREIEKALQRLQDDIRDSISGLESSDDERSSDYQCESNMDHLYREASDNDADMLTSP